MLSTLPLRATVMIAIVVATQVGGAACLAKSAGFRDLTLSVASLAIYSVSFFVLARTIDEGMELSLVMPILAALVPLVTIAVAVAVLGEQASWARLVLLGGACLLIGVAARV